MGTVQAVAESNEVIIEETEKKARTTTVPSVSNTPQHADLSSRKKKKKTRRSFICKYTCLVASERERLLAGELPKRVHVSCVKKLTKDGFQATFWNTQFGDKIH